jgi:glutamine amidotransferase
MIHLVDYGLGNIKAFLNTYKRLDVAVEVARTPADLAGASRIVIPGVGAFDHAMELLDASGMRPALERLVRERGVPVLGICVGMQILCDGSDEGTRPGLGWVPGRVHHLATIAGDGCPPLPHMGWNSVRASDTAVLFRDMAAEPRFYFLHSYAVACADARDVAATTGYGVDFCCALNRGNVFGVQFHPEKSHADGASLLRNFAEL